MSHAPSAQEACTADAAGGAAPPGSVRLAVLYVALAVVAIAANIGAQDLFARLYRGTLDELLSVVAGTAVGLLAKYALDKRFIFGFRARSAAHDARVFLQYAAMGLVTTLVFWALEFGFAHAFGGRAMRYLGGVLGLGLGYYLKYRLDKRFVFRND